MTEEIVEEILENLYSLSESEEKVTLSDLCTKLKMDKAMVAPVVEKMEADGFLEVVDDSLELTHKGSRLGRKMVRKHRLLERFLHDKLGMGKDEVHEEACKLEHALSDEAEDALTKFLNHPNFCPDDEKPIPYDKDCECDVDRNGAIPQVVPLTDAPKGSTVKLRAVQGGKAAVRRLKDMGLVPDVCIKVLKRAPFGGPIELEVCGTKLALGRGIAGKVLVEVI